MLTLTIEETEFYSGSPFLHLHDGEHCLCFLEVSCSRFHIEVIDKFEVLFVHDERYRSNFIFLYVDIWLSLSVVKDAHSSPAFVFGIFVKCQVTKVTCFHV